MKWENLIEKLLEIIKYGRKISFIVAIVSWGIILIPQEIIELLGVEIIIKDHKPTLGIIALISILYYFAVVIYEYLNCFMVDRRSKSTIKKRLKNLTNDEKKALLPYIVENKRTQSFSLRAGVAGGLEVKGIIYRTSIVGRMGAYFPFNIQDIAFDYLMNNKHLLKIDVVEED